MINLNIEIPNGFLEEEIIADYTVTKQMKEVWAVELDLMMQLDKVCKEHNLSYFAGAGTLLGAVRHKGFIPWDDDMDFYMLREDYDKLMQLANEFKEPYFLQNGLTDPENMRKHARIRNSCTTACSDWERYLPGNKGIFIDIFPLDGVSDNRAKDVIQKMQNKYYRMLLKEVFPINNAQTTTIKIKRIIRNMLITITHRNKYKALQKYEATLKRYSLSETRVWGNRTVVFDCPKSRRPIEDWKNITTVPFEFLEIPIPTNYDNILKQQYGNYMEFPKNKNSGKLHQTDIVSTDYSYDELMKHAVMTHNNV